MIYKSQAIIGPETKCLNVRGTTLPNQSNSFYLS